MAQPSENPLFALWTIASAAHPFLARTRCILRFAMRSFAAICLFACLLPQAHASAPPAFAPIPAEVSSSHFIVRIQRQSTPVLHAAVGYYLLNFDCSGPLTVSVTADDPHYWDAGVEVQPMRLNIRPRRQGATITFKIPGPVKLSITRPGDHFVDSDMLFLFANKPDSSGITALTPGVRYYGPGVHRESITANSGDTIYLAAGAVVFGALNLWQVHDVHVLGRGTIVYDGPQNPNDDEGWMHKPDWHLIVMDNARNITIEGITGIVRSRTWMIQMRDSHDIQFRNVKIVGGSPSNANQDGMDWLGGGDTLVDDSFFRAADDVFSMEGNWDGYDEIAITTPGHDVANIVIENSVLSTSISNIVRLGWPRKIFNSSNFTLRDSDVIQAGIGSCGIPFALFEVWADPGGKGTHSGYRFENIRLDDLYSLVQLRQPNPSVSDVSFKDVWTMDGTAVVPSVLKGDILGVTLDGVNTGLQTDSAEAASQIVIEDGAQPPERHASSLQTNFDYTAGLLQPHHSVNFKVAGGGNRGMHYHWLFGDGSEADGAQVHHKFPDTDGTLLDRSGRFRVLLHATDTAGDQAWNSRSVVVASELKSAADPSPSPNQNSQATDSIQATDQIQAPDRVFDRQIRIPQDGGYTFTLLTSVQGSLTIDDNPPAKTPKPRAQVCGSAGDAVQPVRLSVALRAGPHRIRVVREDEPDNATLLADPPLLYWEGPAEPRQPIPASAYLTVENQLEP
jgi:hypothetical protein